MFHICFWFFGFLLLSSTHPSSQSPSCSLIIIRNVFSNFPYHTRYCVYHIYLMSYQNILHFNWEEQESGKRGKAHNFFFFWYFQNLFESEWNFPSVRLCTIAVVDMKFLKGTCLLNFISFNDSFTLFSFLWTSRAQRKEKKNY